MTDVNVMRVKRFMRKADVNIITPKLVSDNTKLSKEDARKAMDDIVYDEDGLTSLFSTNKYRIE